MALAYDYDFCCFFFSDVKSTWLGLGRAGDPSFQLIKVNVVKIMWEILIPML